jgi:hypothetical protein
VPTEVVVGLFTLAGVALGFAGQWLLERWRYNRARRIAVTAVVFEISLLAETVERAAKGGERTQESLRTEWWHRHGPELGNYLPGHLVKALHVLYYEVDRLQHWYSKFTKRELVPTELNQMAAMFLGWAYQVESVVKYIDEHNRRRRRLSMPLVGKRSRPEEEGEQATQFMNEVYRQAVERLRAEGLNVDETGKVVEES